MQPADRRPHLLWAGTALLTFLLLLSWFFHVERTTCFDSAWQTWEMIFERVPRSEHHRHSTMLSQLVPVILLWSDAPLGMVLRAYSVSLIAVHIVLFAMVWACLRDPKAALAIPIALVAMVGSSFYFGVSEVQQGLAAPIVLWALIRWSMDAPPGRAAFLRGGLVLLAATWAAFYHLVLLLPVAYVLGHELIARKAWKDRRYWALAVVILATFLVRNTAIGMSGYEQERMIGLSEFVAVSGGALELRSGLYFMDALPSFPAIWILFGFVMVAAIFLRRWLSLLWTLLWSVCCILVILVVDRDMGAQYMLENLYPIIGVAWAVHASDLYHRAERRQGLAKAFLVLAMLAGAWQIWHARFGAMDKVRYAERITTSLRDRGIRKAVLSAHVLPWTYAQTHWPLPFETVLVSALHGPDEAVTVFAEEPMDKAGACMNRAGQFLGPAWNICSFTNATIDPTYFRLPGEPYVFVSAPPDETGSNADSGAVALEALVEYVAMRSAPYDLIPVRICVRGKEPLKVLLPDVWNMIRCEVYRQRTGELLSSGITALETDVPPGMCQEMAIQVVRPELAGEHIAVLELVMNGQPTGVRDTVHLRVHSLGM